MKKVIAIVMLAVLLVAGGGGYAIWFFVLRVEKPDFDQVGGTILVYEIETRPTGEGRVAYDTAAVANALQARLDPDGRGLAIVSAVGKDRVEIRLPRTEKDHAAMVQRVKDLVAQQGYMEFRILANLVDDKEAIEAATAMLNAQAGVDPQLAAELAAAQVAGAPPPPPREPDSKKPNKFNIVLQKSPSIVTYAWVELGPQERQQLGLHNDAANKPGGGKAWTYLAERRNKASSIPMFDQANDKSLLNGALFFSRECLDENLPEEERVKKKIDYLVLARNPEIDPATGLPTPKLDGGYIVSAMNQTDAAGRPALSFTLNAAGGEVMRNLTRKNAAKGPEGLSETSRHLAIILDGLVMSAPTINDEIGQHGQISGNFTKREVEQLVNILRAGALPPTLNTRQVSETEVPPKSGK